MNYNVNVKDIELGVTEVKGNGETFTLLERTDGTFGNNGEWLQVRYRVGFKSRYGTLDTGGQFYRTITEIGTPNTHKPEPIPGMDYKAPVVEESVIEGTTLDKAGLNQAIAKLDKVVVKSTSKHRGRPPVAMNELKAKNAIRDYKQGIREANDSLVEEAFDWLLEDGQDSYLEKHFLRKD